MRWRVGVLGGAALALLPWIAVLALTLRDAAGWVLLDLGEAVCLAGAALLLHRGSGLHRLFAAGAALLLVGDACWDIGSSATGGDLLAALGMGVGAELPLAAICAALVLRRRRPAALAAARPVLALAA
ncbi:hypothetical protein LN042_23375 [Kitasatospora sp. RB6PN24]|uniref:hypothetical protein n=1 Tax=Kitasatospora humi TaxID=2893891 RepID=UPI001E5B8982|nr:hypothetical protein [Kitasatospora humi]MCC9309979.1 hypothetical protein [Kitasatospora humi]